MDRFQGLGDEGTKREAGGPMAEIREDRLSAFRYPSFFFDLLV
jgi:hypothetical protein